MAHGRVKWFDDKKGYGFISVGEQGGDVFVHYSAIQSTGYRTLREGQEVDFEVSDGPRGLQASQVSAQAPQEAEG